jgi:chemotaxis protein histidine kinase CheA
MSRHSVTFLIAFLLTVSGVAPLVYYERPLLGLGAGLVGLVAHWRLSRGRDRDGEVADSSYFFGFLLTLVFLTVGLYRIGVQAGAAAGSIHILGFLEDLAAGLALTIAGLLIRQVRTLGHASDATEERTASESSLAEVQRQLADNIKAMIELWRARPEHQVLDALEQSRSAARDAATRLDRDLAAASGRMLESVERLDQATRNTMNALTRSAESAGRSMTDLAERLEVDIGTAVRSVQSATSQVLQTIEEQRTAANQALTSAQAHHQQQLELWRSNLEQARTALEQAHRGLDEQYRRSMAGFAASGEAFAELASKTTAHIESLPDPAARLAGLWDGVRRLETDLTSAIAGAVMELGTLRERAEQLRTSLDQLGGSTDRAADMIGSGGDRLAGSLQRELAQMNSIIDEYVTLLEKTPRSLKVRA